MLGTFSQRMLLIYGILENYIFSPFYFGDFHVYSKVEAVNMTYHHPVGTGNKWINVGVMRHRQSKG